MVSGSCLWPHIARDPETAGGAVPLLAEPTEAATGVSSGSSVTVQPARPQQQDSVAMPWGLSGRGSFRSCGAHKGDRQAGATERQVVKQESPTVPSSQSDTLNSSESQEIFKDLKTQVQNNFRL